MAEPAPTTDTTTSDRPPQELVVLAGVVGSGKSSLSERWIEVVPGWARVNRDDLGDRRTCENALRSSLRQGLSVIVDRQNFDAGQRRTWLEIANEFEGVKVGGMVLGTSKEECRERLLKRENHPTIDNSELAVSLLDKFSGLWQEPTLDEGFDHLLTLPPLPLPPQIDSSLISSLLTQLHSSPLNPSARDQRKPRPRPEPYRRPDGFVDDGTWRPPPPVGRGGEGGGYVRGGYGGSGGFGAGGYNAGGGWGGNAAGGGYGYRPPAQPAYGAYSAGGQGGWQQQQQHQPYYPEQRQYQPWGGAGGYGQAGGAGRGGGGWQQGVQTQSQSHQQEQHHWGGGGQRLGGPGP